jgi:hypothetical protein
MARIPDLSIDPSRVLSSLPHAQREATSPNIRSSVISFGTMYVRSTEKAVSLAEAARDGETTLTRAVTLRAHVAKSVDEVHAAKHLIRRRYAWRGYAMPKEEEASVGEAFESESSQAVLVALDHGATVGTVTMGFDGVGGLLAERSYPEAIGEQRAAGGRICEVMRLALAERTDSKVVLAALFSMLLNKARSHGITHMFIEVNPRHVVFYQKVLGFSVAGGERFCERAQAPSVLLCVDMDAFEQRVRAYSVKFARQELEARAA